MPILLFPILVHAEKIDATTLLSILQNKEVHFIVPWDADGNNDLLCVLTLKRESAPNTLPTRVMTIYKKKDTQLNEIYEFLTPDFPVNIYQMGESCSRLFTAWTGGSAHHFNVFAYSEGRIVKVLEISSKLMPEFAIDKSGNEIILVTQLAWKENKKTGGKEQVPDSTNIYKWNGKEYMKIKVVPWKSRFEFLRVLAN